jgi:GNAT superfamily N-acetyltransferase
VTIQQLAAGDGSRLRAVRLRALCDSPDAFWTTQREAAEWPAARWEEMLVETAVYVAVCGGMDVGIARGARDERRPDVAMLHSMWVAPEFRGRGVGDALIAAVAEWAYGQSLTELVLEVGDNNGPALALYARNGFVPTGMVSHLPPPRDHIREHEQILRLDRCTGVWRLNSAKIVRSAHAHPSAGAGAPRT